MTSSVPLMVNVGLALVNFKTMDSPGPETLLSTIVRMVRFCFAFPGIHTFLCNSQSVPLVAGPVSCQRHLYAGRLRRVVQRRRQNHIRRARRSLPAHIHLRFRGRLRRHLPRHRGGVGLAHGHARLYATNTKDRGRSSDP